MWRPDSGRSPNRGFVMASEDVWVGYLRSMREIERTWRSEPPTPDEYAIDVEERMDAAAKMRDADWRALRAEVHRQVTQEGRGGPFLIPV